MNSNFPGDAPPGGRSGRKALAIAGIGIVAFFFLINDIMGWIEGGGFFSIISSVHAVQKKARVVDVDGAGLRTMFMAGCSLFVTCLGIQLNADLRKRLTLNAIIFPVIAGGFILDGVYGETVIQSFMAQRGYSRCAARDHTEGTGKGRVWFKNYVRASADCPPDAVLAPAELPGDPRSELPRPARSIGPRSAWFTSDDYPASALRQRLGGRVRVRFLVNTDGRVERCVTILSSGSPSLDSATCGVLMANAHYWPARDAAGNAIVQTGTFGARWHIPDD